MFTPLVKHFKLPFKSCPQSEEDMKKICNVPYSNAVGTIMYAIVCTRPNRSYAVNMVSRYMHKPGKDH